MARVMSNVVLKLWEQRAQYFPSKTKTGKYSAMACQLLYDNKDILNKSDSDLYDCFDNTFEADKLNFTKAKSLYTYFSLIVELYDGGLKPAKDLFNKQDDIVEKIENEIKNYSKKLNILIQKKDSGAVLTKNDARYKTYYEASLKAYHQILNGIKGKTSIRSTCENLIPMYKRDFETH